MQDSIATQVANNIVPVGLGTVGSLATQATNFAATLPTMIAGAIVGTVVGFIVNKGLKWLSERFF